MPNTIPDVDDRLLELPLVRTGDPVRSADIRPILQLHNCALAETSTGPVIQQEWPDGQCTHTGAIPADTADIPIAEWAVPIVSDAHLTLALELRGYVDAGATSGTVTFRSVGAGDEVTLALPIGAAAGGTWRDVGDLALDVFATVEGDRVELVQMFLETEDSPGDAVVHQVAGEIAALGSPLAAVRIDDVAPMDPDKGDPDEPLPSATGHNLIAGDAALRPRPHLGIAWSGLAAAYTEPAAADELPDVDVLGAMRDMPGHGIVVMVRRPETESGRIAVPPLDGRLSEGDDGDPVWVSGSAETYAAGQLRPADPSISAVGALHQPGAGGISGLTLWTHPVDGPAVQPLTIGEGIGLLRTPPIVPDPDAVDHGRIVLVDQVQSLGASVLHHAWVRAVRRVVHTVEYRAATRATIPTPVTGTWRTVWTTSKVARWALLVVRYQGGEGTSGPEMQMDVELQDRDDAGAVLDSFTIPTAALRAPGWGEPPTPEWWVAPLEIGDDAPRPLALPDPGGRRVELVIDGTDVRVLSVTVLELVPDALETPPEA